MLVLRNVLCVVLGVGVLWSLVHSGYELTACLHALRVYSLLVVALEGVCRYASAPAALPDASKGRTKRQARIVEILSVVGQSICSVLLTHVVAVLFGAYVIENFEATFTLSLLVASLAFIRPLIFLGRSAFISLLERQNTESESEVKTFAVLVAAWAGAFPIPLDWDRPWQVWPLTCSIGAILGELGASLYLLVTQFSNGGLQWKNKAR